MSNDFQWETIPRRIELKRIRPERNERRFYAVEISFDLFGGLGLSRSWGRIGTAGRQRMDLCPDLSMAMQALAKLIEAKRKRGYQSLSAKLLDVASTPFERYAVERPSLWKRFDL